MSIRPGSVGLRESGCRAARGARGSRGGARRAGAVLLLAALFAGACGKDNGGNAGADSAARDSVRRLPASDSLAGAGGTGGAGAGAGRGPAGETAAGSRTVLFVGTSLTAGLGLDPDSAYPALIQRKIDSAGLPFRAVNAGVSGETTAALLRRLDWLLRQPAAVIVVETGANDGLRGIPVETARENIGAVLRRIRASQPQARVVLVQMEAPPNLGRRYVAAFRAMYGELAREHGAVLMPFLLDGVAGESGLNQADGIHPNGKGERKVAENVWRTLGPVLGAIQGPTAAAKAVVGFEKVRSGVAPWALTVAGRGKQR
ncbi:MAG: arylesterase [Gemmatimonadaceae bacterium]